MTEQKKTVAVVGGTGSAGGAFLRLALGHPLLKLTQVACDEHAGEPLSDWHPALRGRTALTFVRTAELLGADIVVLALPRGEGASRLHQLEGLGRVLLDLSGDFRLKDAQRYRAIYGEPHAAPEKLGEWVYGSPELNRDALRGAGRIAAPDHLATALVLALYPLLKLGVLLPRDIVATGLVGAGAGDGPAVDCPVERQHLAEARQALPGNFPLHLTSLRLPGGQTPNGRGVLLTVQAWVPDGYSDRDVWSAYREVYGAEPFIRLIRGGTGHPSPDPALLLGTNFCDLGAEMDDDTGRVVLMSALDPLGKGTVGPAVQSLNIALGWPETAGLEFAGL